jgi:hypothetical protein
MLVNYLGTRRATITNLFDVALSNGNCLALALLAQPKPFFGSSMPTQSLLSGIFLKSTATDLLTCCNSASGCLLCRLLTKTLCKVLSESISRRLR